MGIDACVIGYGVVGQATAAVFGIDKYFDLNGSTITLERAAKTKYIFLCLPTPVKDGRYNIEATREIVKQIAGYGCGGILINRSTVTPGTARALSDEFQVSIVANPEFLDQQTAEHDAKHPSFIILGGDLKNYTAAVRGLYDSRFKGIDVIETDTVTAEMVKVSMNAFFGTKVVFANELYDVCKKNGADYGKVKEALEKHRYGSKNHFGIFHKGGRGAGGRCLSKDLEAFTDYSKSDLLQVVQRINKELLEEYPKTEI